MYHLRAISALLVLAVLTPEWHMGLAYSQLKEAIEPPLEIELNIDGQSFAAQIGHPTIVGIDGKKVRIVVSTGEERVLKLQHLHFRYPNYFKFNVSFSDGMEEPVRWDLEGYDIEVTVFRTSSNALRYQNAKQPLTNWMTRAFGKNVVVGDATVLELGKLKLQGTKYLATIGNGSFTAELKLEVFEVPGCFGNVRYFLLLSDWDGENPKEELLVRDLLRRSFEVVR